MVRKHVGYARYDTPEAVALLNELYDRLRLMVNFVRPCAKLIEKTRHGARGTGTAARLSPAAVQPSQCCFVRRRQSGSESRSRRGTGGAGSHICDVAAVARTSGRVGSSTESSGPAGSTAVDIFCMVATPTLPRSLRCAHLHCRALPPGGVGVSVLRVGSRARARCATAVRRATGRFGGRRSSRD